MGDFDWKTHTWNVIDRYFRDNRNFFTNHHISSYESFLQDGIPSILQAHNPVTIFKDNKEPDTKKLPVYKYKLEIFVGGIDGTRIHVGKPTYYDHQAKEDRILYPNEARLRNLDYIVSVHADLVVRLTLQDSETTVIEYSWEQDERPELRKVHIASIPLMLQSKYCPLSQLSDQHLSTMGECRYDQGGYFIIRGQEKVIIPQEKQAFNRLNIRTQKHHPSIQVYGGIMCYNEESTISMRNAFTVDHNNRIRVRIPNVNREIPLFIVFRALGLETDRSIIQTCVTQDEMDMYDPYLRACVEDSTYIQSQKDALQYIASLTKMGNPARALQILHSNFLIHMDKSFHAKTLYLGYITKQILRRLCDQIPDTDKDSFFEKRIALSGQMLQELFHEYYIKYIKEFSLLIDKRYNYHKTNYQDEAFIELLSKPFIQETFGVDTVTKGVMRGMKGNWGASDYTRIDGASQTLERLSYFNTISHLRRVQLDFDTSLKTAKPRYLHHTSFGYMCPSETPTGAKIGIIKYLALLTHVSAGEPTKAVRDVIAKLQDNDKEIGITYLNDVSMDDFQREKEKKSQLVMNGMLIGLISMPQRLMDQLRSLKIQGVIHPYTSVSFDYDDNTMHVFTDAGRVVRPLYPMNKGEFLLTKEQVSRLQSQGMTWNKITRGQGVESPAIVEWVDPYEQNAAYICMDPTRSHDTNIQYTHCEVHPSTLQGVMGSLIPYTQHNQSPRNQYSTAQSKQALSVYTTSFNHRIDTFSYVLQYPQKPLVSTRYAKYYTNGELGYGINAIVAISTWTGYNQEDGIMMNKSSVDRGLFRNFVFKSIQDEEEYDHARGTRVVFKHPFKATNISNQKIGYNYKKLYLEDGKRRKDKDALEGIVAEGVTIGPTDIVIGKVGESKFSHRQTDQSTSAGMYMTGKVDKVLVVAKEDGSRACKIRVSQYRTPQLGDKFSSRAGQKGTVGMLIAEEDMPRTADGIVPDIVVNPHAIPSRMTIGQLLECVIGKACAMEGTYADATAFVNTRSPTTEFGTILKERHGFEEYGNEVMYNGRTGQQLATKIFIGPTYYMRLKHMVKDKMNARATGAREMRTHQPVAGRGRGGGLRLGEMERDVFLAHGISEYISDAYMNRSDGYELSVCSQTGDVAVKNDARGLYHSPARDGTQWKQKSQFSSQVELQNVYPSTVPHVSKVTIPYVAKLVKQELDGMANVGMKLVTTDNIPKLLTSKESIEAHILSYIKRKTGRSKKTSGGGIVTDTIERVQQEANKYVDVMKDFTTQLESVIETTIQKHKLAKDIDEDSIVSYNRLVSSRESNDMIHINDSIEDSPAMTKENLIQVTEALNGSQKGGDRINVREQTTPAIVKQDGTNKFFSDYKGDETIKIVKIE